MSVRTPEKGCWYAMKNRCANPAHSSYKYYGGRGITVCPRWLESFDNFLADMGPRPGIGFSIDRYPNNNGNYEPGNCRWATSKQQGENTRKAPKIVKPARVRVATKDIDQRVCLRCGYEWYPRRPRLPFICPKCKRDTWNEQDPSMVRGPGRPPIPEYDEKGAQHENKSISL